MTQEELLELFEIYFQGTISSFNRDPVLQIFFFLKEIPQGIFFSEAIISIMW